MAFCNKCGLRVDDEAVHCPACGTQLRDPNVNDQGGFGWGLLGFCFPFVAFILWLVWKDEKPRKASSVCTGAWISIGISLALNLFSLIFGMLEALI